MSNLAQSKSPSTIVKMQAITSARKRPKRAEREPRRSLVRWSEKLDQFLLLAVDYVCKQHGIKIPYGEVAKIIGPEATAGAVEQHLGKLRKKRQDNGEPVPPLPRGSRTEKAKLAPNVKTLPISKIRVSSRYRSKRINYSDDGPELSELDPDIMSDDERSHNTSVTSNEKQTSPTIKLIKHEEESTDGSPKKKRKLSPKPRLRSISTEASVSFYSDTKKSVKAAMDLKTPEASPPRKVVKLKIAREEFSKHFQSDNIQNIVKYDNSVIQDGVSLPRSDLVEPFGREQGLETTYKGQQHTFLGNQLSSIEQNLHVIPSSYSPVMSNLTNSYSSMQNGFQFTSETDIQSYDNSDSFVDMVYPYPSPYVPTFSEQQIQRNHDGQADFDSDSANLSNFDAEIVSEAPHISAPFEPHTSYDSFYDSFQYSRDTTYGYPINQITARGFSIE